MQEHLHQTNTFLVAMKHEQHYEKIKPDGNKKKMSEMKSQK